MAPRLKVLIIDDSVAFSEMVKDVLTKHGLQVCFSQSIEKAFDLIHEEMPDLILLDLLFPDEHGFTILKKLRKDKKYKSLKIIVVSSENDASVIKKAFKLGADDYITKPLNIQNLKNKCYI